MAIRSLESTRPITGFYQLDGLSSAKSCPGTGTVVLLQCEGTPVRYRPDGVDPTTSVGIKLAVGETHVLNVGQGNIPNLRIIETAASAKVNIITFR